MELTLVCNAGLALTYQGKTLLIDCFNRPFLDFYPISQEMEEILLADDTICGSIYTHQHWDHFNPVTQAKFMENHPQAVEFLPGDNTANHGTLQAGPFCVEYSRFPHTACDYPTDDHFVLYVTAGEQSVYISADAQMELPLHKEFLKGRIATCGFFSALYGSYRPVRTWLAETFQYPYIYHIPTEEMDTSGIHHRVKRIMERMSGEHPTIKLLDQYPQKLQR